MHLIRYFHMFNHFIGTGNFYFTIFNSRNLNILNSWDFDFSDLYLRNFNYLFNNPIYRYRDFYANLSIDGYLLNPIYVFNFRGWCWYCLDNFYLFFDYLVYIFYYLDRLLNYFFNNFFHYFILILYLDFRLTTF